MWMLNGPNFINFIFSDISVKSNLALTQQKNRFFAFLSRAKSRSDLKVSTLGMIFCVESACHAQKFVAPPKQTIF